MLRVPVNLQKPTKCEMTQAVQPNHINSFQTPATWVALRHLEETVKHEARQYNHLL